MTKFPGLMICIFLSILLEGHTWWCSWVKTTFNKCSNQQWLIPAALGNHQGHTSRSESRDHVVPRTGMYICSRHVLLHLKYIHGPPDLHSVCIFWVTPCNVSGYSWHYDQGSLLVMDVQDQTKNYCTQGKFLNLWTISLAQNFAF